METTVKRIDLAQATDITLDAAINDLCNNMDAADMKLVSTSIYQNQLLLIFQDK